ncbi:hypothetical protein MMX123_00382 [Microbacterium sp. MM2322]|uniref:hypothetical protein n=1 Tax=unclassified Microbacterium TaxID=2609290 RepID=UPI0017831F17|nr:MULTISPECIES: hypothetical protein [unclassified Microbacterium]MBD8206748.1 hypothetical protein [Microbacterium sp. CFBP 8801]MBD8217503.1 hypothetical protein [Microbacterium sp. CFBP 13617]MBD8509167.1 hypothetical protein [Microbacterium sp. CFBP 8790]
MSTDSRRGGDSRRTRARRRRGRGFLVAFAAVLGALALVGGVGGVVAVAQGPRVTDVQVDPTAAVAASGSRVILTTTQSLETVDPSQVQVEPATPFTVDTAGRSVGVRFTLPLRDDTDYRITVNGVSGLGAGPASTLTETFRTPPLQAYLMQRGTPEGDTIFRTDLQGEAGLPVFVNAHIEDFRATANHLVISVRDGDTARVIVTDSDGGNPRDIALPGPGFVSNLQSADRGERIGFTFSDADLGAAGGRESRLFTASAADDAAPTEVGLNGGDVRIADWRFVPDTDSMLVLTFDSRLLLTDAQGGNAAPLGSAVSIDGIARGSSVAIVERVEGIREINLTDGSEQPLVQPVDPPGLAGRATPVPGAGAGTIRSFADISADGVSRSTTVAHVDTDGAVRSLLEVPGSDTVLQTCVSPSGRYAAVLVAPRAVDNPFDRYQLPLPEKLQTHLVEVDTGQELVALQGFDLSWCQVPPQ